MKRRNFIAATGVIFASGVTSNLNATASTYNSLSAQVSLNEFSKKSKFALDNFIAELEQGFFNHPDKSKFINNIAMPIRLIDKQSKKNGIESVSYVNANSEYIKITIKKGVQEIRISKTPFKS